MTLDDNIIFNDVYLYNPSNSDQSLTPLTPISKMFASFDGIHSGVPTRTTSTITPTTLKNIEQTFMELTNDSAPPVPCQAGFVPPPLQQQFQNFDDQDNNSDDSNSSVSHGSWQATPPPMISEDMDSKSSSPSGGRPSQPSRRNMGGRRPNKPSNLSPEEEEKRKVRRERNKLAAARCRRRREDHTNELVDETDGLEKKKQALQAEIQQLQSEKEDLEFLLDSHRAHCRLQGRQSPEDVKPNIITNNAAAVCNKIKAEPIECLEGQPPLKKLILSNGIHDILDTPTTTSVAPVLTSVNISPMMSKPNRPLTLNVKSTQFPLLNMNRVIAGDTGIGITTPSTGLFNFDSLMEGRTGLTPTTAPLLPNRNPMELVTPTSNEQSKLCSL